ncbi:hypothetical protein [Neobacillus sp. LXY-4]|uniref:hypothetical protein n=1 Tax=Neobacillus sp. LXY-4 TaxID=3379826 RepID=UPI003EE35A9D
MKPEGKILLRLIQLVSVLMIFYLLIVQLQFRNTYAASWDQVDFALALVRYDIMAMQPHFPGYPYFILGGMLVSTIIKNPTEALTVFNILVYGSAIVPIYLLMRNTVTKKYSLLVTAIIYTGSYTVTMVNQPMSEGAAIACLWWFVWSIQFALGRSNIFPVILPLWLFSVLLGIRLSYLPFAVGIVYLFIIKWKRRQLTNKMLLVYVVLAALFQGIWVGAIAISEGGLIGFIKLALAFTSGHFNDWGGTVSTVDPSMFIRLKALILENLLWSGFSAHSKLLLSLYLLLFIVFIKKLKWKDFIGDVHFHLPILLFLCYFIWAYLAQNIDKPRHILPLAGFGVWIVFLLLYKSKQKGLLVALSIVILIVQTGYSTMLIKEQATKTPAVHQAGEFLSKLEDPFIVYTWEETRVFQYLDVPFLHKRIQTYEVFKQDISNYSDHTVLLTDKVVAGFRQQGIKVDKQIEKIEEFHSNELFDPIYNEVTIYRWKKHPGVK